MSMQIFLNDRREEKFKRIKKRIREEINTNDIKSGQVFEILANNYLEDNKE